MTKFSLLILFGLGIFATPGFAGDDPDHFDPADVNALTPSEVHQKMWEDLKPRLMQRQAMERSLADKIATNWQDYDMRYYHLDLDIDHVSEVIYGRVSCFGDVVVASLDSVMLNLISQLTVDSVYNDSGRLTISHLNDHLKVRLDRTYLQGEQFHFTVVYHGTPTGTGFLGFDFGTRNSLPLITTLSEPYGARSWWPCNDIPRDKVDSVDIVVTAASFLKVSSNGTLLSDIDNGDGTHTVHWAERYPITTYLVSLGIHPYAVWNDWYHYTATDSMLLLYHVYPDHDATSRPYFAIMPDVMEKLENRFGRYPFISEKYGLTHFPWGGAMEHQTNTSTTSSGFGYSTAVIVHELGHQWWGDMVTCDDWHHIWINEGFATYSEALYDEQANGVNSYHAYMNGMEFTGGGSVYIQDTTSVGIIFGSIVYDKGAWVLHMLRRVIGDAAFFQTLQDFRSQYLWKTATTENFRDVAEAASGMDLDWFFQEWIYGTFRPAYAYSSLIQADPGGGYNTYIHIRQTQATTPTVFTMPVDIKLNFASGNQTTAIFNYKRAQNFTIHTTSQPLSVAIDPDRWISRTLTPETYTLHIVNDTLEDGTQGTLYQDTVKVKGGLGSYQCQIISGALPPGLTLNSANGTVVGTSWGAGDYTFMVRAVDQTLSSYRDSVQYTISLSALPPRPGDVNIDGPVNVGDVVYMINRVFKSGPPPIIPPWADVNNDCLINVADAIALINHIFKQGPPPVLGCAV